MDNIKKLLESHDHYDNFMRGKVGYLDNGDIIEYHDTYVLINDKTYQKYVTCPLCNKQFRRITNTHLWKSHNMTVDEFKESFPNSPMVSEFTAYLNAYKHKGKTYEEIMGADKANVLKLRRSENAKKQFEDSEQRSLRSDALKGLSKHVESVEKQLETKFGDIDLNYREKALSYYGEECQLCGTEDNLVVHHKDLNHYDDDNFFTNNDIDNLEVLCKSCHAKSHNVLNPGYFEGKSKIEKAFAEIISGLYIAYGLDKNDENLKDTPSRVARAYLEMLQGINPESAKSILVQNFPSDYDGMVVLDNIQCYSMCPHHFLPVKYSVDFGYIPNGRVLGLSKIPRYIKLLLQAPKLQEDATEQLIQYFMDIVKPAGCMVILKGQHLCMGCRGVEMPNVATITSSRSGLFKKEDVKEEFINILSIRKS